jgi:PAS domain S-box-containing protein
VKEDEFGAVAQKANEMAWSLERIGNESKKAERRFRALMESAPDAMVIVDHDGRIVLVNARTETVFGYSRDELLGEQLKMLVSKGLADEPPISAREPALEWYGRRNDGTQFPIEVTSNPLDTDEGALVSSAIRDITERKIAETALKVANRELEAFSYSVAHDLRAPLRGMNGFAQVLLDGYKDKLDAEGKDFLEEILNNAQRMGALIDALLSLARVTRTDLKPQRVDLSAVVHASASQLAASETQRQVEVVIQDDLWADVDPQLARAVMDNLLGNAWKFTSKVPSARVEFGHTVHNGIQAYYIRDNGAGFDMAFAANLFAPFHRLHTVSEFPGTGIGLATVQRIIHRHGGEIWAAGSVDGGATFYFSLPTRAIGITS